MHRWELADPAEAEFADLNEAVQPALTEFMDAVVLVDPIEYQRRPDEAIDTQPVANSTSRSVDHEDALVMALETTWRAVPPDRLGSHTGTAQNCERFTSQVRTMLTADRQVRDDRLVQAAYLAGIAWLRGGKFDKHFLPGDDVVLGQRDCNLANFLWDGRRIRLVDFEDSGASDRAFELASFVEHVSVWSESCLEAEPFLAKFELSRRERSSLREFRRLRRRFIASPGVAQDCSAWP